MDGPSALVGFDSSKFFTVPDSSFVVLDRRVSLEDLGLRVRMSKSGDLGLDDAIFSVELDLSLFVFAELKKDRSSFLVPVSLLVLSACMENFRSVPLALLDFSLAFVSVPFPVEDISVPTAVLVLKGAASVLVPIEALAFRVVSVLVEELDLPSVFVPILLLLTLLVDPKSRCWR